MHKKSQTMSLIEIQTHFTSKLPFGVAPSECQCTIITRTNSFQIKWLNCAQLPITWESKVVTSSQTVVFFSFCMQNFLQVLIIHVGLFIIKGSNVFILLFQKRGKTILRFFFCIGNEISRFIESASKIQTAFFRLEIQACFSFMDPAETLSSDQNL